MGLTIACLVVLAMFSGADLATPAQNPPVSARSLVSITSGQLPIIVSAPHGGKEAIAGVSQRQGTGVERFNVGRDTRTDDLAELVALELEKQLHAKPFGVIARFERKYLDVNRSSDAAFESGEVKRHYETYHAALRDFTQRVKAQWGSGLLLDIHGEGADAAAIYRGTQNGKTVKSLLQRFGAPAVSGKQSVLGQMAGKGYKVLPSNGDNDKETRYLGGYIVQRYGSHQQLGIDAIQLEFGSSLRSRANLERTARDLAHSIEVFAREYLPILKPDSDPRSAQ
jgi:N-formylglutamate amidohydrolase